jgi:PPOX class probable FMN-dependent enzyme
VSGGAEAKGGVMTDDDGTRVRDDATLRALYGPVLPAAATKELDHLAPPYRGFIEVAPFVVLATVGPGGVEVSPRGDPAPIATVEDARTLLLPDRRGNNRLDALRNILVDPRVSLLFLIPGVGEGVRVSGRAEIRVDPELLARFAMNGKPPITVLRVAVERVYYQCSKSIARARLWEPDAREDRSRVPSVGAMLAAASAAPIDAAETDAAYRDRQKALY